jgi:lysophospholipase L1-like esterase
MLIHHPATYLALGDSYTIGEGVPLHENYPYQLVQLLRKKGQHLHAAEVIARTGWTSTELGEHLIHTQLEEKYDWVSLLIGVNNHYRGMTVSDFHTDLQFLVGKCIHLCRQEEKGVWVLGIPDWTVTPFAAQADQRERSPLTEFNERVKTLSTSLKVNYLDLTASSRYAAEDPEGLCTDGLHYSGKTYRTWAELLENGWSSIAEM